MKPLFFILGFFFLNVHSQDWEIPNTNNKSLEIDEPLNFSTNRKHILLISEASIYAISLVGLNQLWYADYPRSSFHFINDNYEWLQMDKMGHMTTSYYAGVLGINAYSWAGFSRNNTIWYGGLTGSFFLTIIEILDGTSMEWGASVGDLIANTSGSLLAIGQALKWGEQKIQLKYSYSPSKWAIINPKQLGSSDVERVLKDYNGQTYWLTFNIRSLLNIKNKVFPSWLSLAFGYGANSMLSPYSEDEFNSYRQYFLSFDIDLNKINTRNKTVNTILHTFGYLKFPAPALEFRKSKFLFHPIYY